MKVDFLKRKDYKNMVLLLTVTFGALLLVGFWSSDPVAAFVQKNIGKHKAINSGLTPSKIAQEYYTKELNNEQATGTKASLKKNGNKNNPDNQQEMPGEKIIKEKNLAGDYCLKVPVLTYHHIAPEAEAVTGNFQTLNVTDTYFENHLAYLKNQGYNFIRAEDLVTNLLAKKNELGSKPIVLTFDDGYEDIYTHAFPLAQKYQAIINLMIPTGLIGQPGYLTWYQLREMKKSGLVHIYNHTVTHSNLKLDTIEQIQYQINFSQVSLNQELGLTPKILAYPYGGLNDIAISEVKDSQFLGAFSTYQGYDECLSEIYILKRKRVGNAELSLYGL